MKASKNATVAKIRAVYGKRLKENDYYELSAKKKVSEAAEYLKRNTHFSAVLSNIDTSVIHRGFLESLLNKAYYDQYERLCRFQHLNEEPFYNFLLVRFEIRELLKAILYLNNDSSDVYIESMHAYLLKKASFDLIELAKASDFRQLLNVIRHTPYYNIIKNIETDKNGIIPYTKCEVMLRTYYMKWLIETAKKDFSGTSQTALLDQFNIQTDVINIINAYRMKKYFNADINFLKDNMLPFYGKAHVAYIPNGYITGLSKIARVVDVFSHRLQVQERMTLQIKECIQETLNPLGVMVVVEAKHMCMQMRGVEKQNAITTTSDFTGAFNQAKTREEFMNLIRHNR